MTRTREENAADLAAEPIRIRAEAIKAALEYGYKYNETGELCAPLGKFECEPYYALYFYQAMLDGGTVEPLFNGEVCDGDVLEVSDAERAAFGIDAAFVVLWYSEQGLSLQELTADEYDKLRARYDALATHEEDLQS